MSSSVSSSNNKALPPAAEAPAPAPQGETTHTTQKTQSNEEFIKETLEGQESPSAVSIVGTAGLLGYNWTIQEAERFLAYNKDKKRTDGWEFAIRKWEAQRSRHKSGSDDLTDKEREEMEAYLSLTKRY